MHPCRARYQARGAVSGLPGPRRASSAPGSGRCSSSRPSTGSGSSGRSGRATATARRRPSRPASPPRPRHCGALLRGLGITRAHWVGHSSSCCIGLQLALDDPGLVASLTLFEPAKPSGGQRAAAASGYVGPALGRPG